MVLLDIRAAGFLVFLLALAGARTRAQGERDARWRADLAVLAREFPRRHKNAFAVLSRAEFERQVAAIDEAIPRLSDDQVEVALMGLIARVGDSHSGVRGRRVFSGKRIPLWLHWFSDGLRILGVPGERRALLGARVISIEGKPVSVIAARLGEVVCFGNEAWMRCQVPGLVVFPRLLVALGLAGSREKLTLEIQGDGAGSQRVEIPAAAPGARLERLHPRRSTLFDQRGRAWHHFEFKPDEGLLYVQYNRCASSGEHDLKKFTAELEELCAAGKVKTFVLDLRFNSGGSSMLGSMMLARLAAYPPLKQKKNIFCLIGRRTFSSAILNAMEIKKRYGAIFLGEPTGGGPNHFGEVRSFELPGSKLQVAYSTKYFRRVAGEAHTIEPDELIEESFADFLEGRNRLLARIRELVKRGP